MSYTTRNGQPQGITYYFTNKIREAMIAEIIAINGYAEHIANSNMEEINAAWKSIMGDEKKHYGMFLTLLRAYDPNQYEKYQEDKCLKYGPKTPMQTYKPSYDTQIILNNLRQDIKGELEAVILYEQEFADIPCDDIRRVFYTIATEEKGHLEHLTQLLLKYDTDKYGSLD
ncbi:ferritin family protein [Pelosinus sp. UFO1]|uniref:ferritin family protein n=1 Tax=Pelosinus sp. UFO1 TaxID=484770 RepID=UPI0004D192F3|nr:ferritin family protein [Pelosinus sp. UFO1]AIF51004.1 Rubrerythrin [Pelosinus sp. UFO1]